MSLVSFAICLMCLASAKCLQIQERSKPAPIAFYAYLNKYLDKLKPEDVIKYDKVITNEGNSYNGNTGVFACHRPGLYQFTWNVMVRTKKSTEVALKVNKNKLGWANSGSSTTGYANSANSLIVRLKAGDHVWIENVYADGSLHQHHTTFSGHFMSA